MKKLALLLGALSLVSSVAYAKEVVPAVEEVVVVEEAAPVVAAPALTVTYVGQSLEVDNDSGSTADIGEGVFFGNSVGLAYEDWTFDLFARKGWSWDTDDGIHSDSHRLQLDAWRHFDNYSLGLRYRGEKDKDSYYLRGKYNYGMFSGSLDVAYRSKNGASGKSDAIYIETTPVAVQVGPVKVGYYFEADDIALNTSKGEQEHWWRHQLRVGAPIYTGEKLSLGLEYRWQFDTDVEYDGTPEKAYKEANSNTHVLYLSGSYAVTENLSIDGYYQYDMKEFDAHNGTDKEAGVDDNKYYGEFGIGWTYSF